MNIAIATILQLTASLLMSAQNNTKISAATSQQIVATASHVVQLSTQALVDIPFPVVSDDSIWPNVQDLQNAGYFNNAPYFDYASGSGQWMHLGQNVELVPSSISFGDLNADGLDDATVVVKETPPSGVASFALATMLNQGGTLFNIDNTPLGTVAPIIFSHEIQNGELVMDMEVNGTARSVVRYSLWGNRLIEN